MTANLVTFTLTSAVLVAVPGPSVLFIVSRALAEGRQTALRTVLGNSAGLLVQVVAVAAGLGTLVSRSIALYNAMRLIGAFYLIVLGARTLISTRKQTGIADQGRASTTRVFREGFIVGVGNPKTIVFFAAFLPQFLTLGDVDRSLSAPSQMLLFGLIFVCVALLLDSLWALVAGTARNWFVSSPRRMTRMQQGGGLIMIGLGLRLAAIGRKP